MPTDHACHAAVEQTAQSLTPVRAYLGTAPQGGAHGARGADADGLSAGAAVLLAFLDGLRADLEGELTEWYTTLGDRLADALGLPVSGAAGPPPAFRPSHWEALALVKDRAEEVFTALAERHRNRPARPGELSWRTALVEDALAGTLHRTAVPGETAVQCAEGVAAAAGALFGLRPPSPPPQAQRSAPPPPAATVPMPEPTPEPATETARPARPAAPTRFPDWITGLP